MTKKAVFITWLQTTKKPIGKPIRNNYFKRSTESDAHSLRVSKSYLPFTTFLPCRFLSILIVCGSSRLVPGRENEKKKCMKLKRPKTFTVWLKRKDSRNWGLKSIDSEVFNDVVLVFEAYIFFGHLNANLYISNDQTMKTQKHRLIFTSVNLWSNMLPFLSEHLYNSILRHGFWYHCTGLIRTYRAITEGSIGLGFTSSGCVVPSNTWNVVHKLN